LNFLKTLEDNEALITQVRILDESFFLHSITLSVHFIIVEMDLLRGFYWELKRYLSVFKLTTN